MRISILDLAPLSLNQTASETFRNTSELAQRAEEWGYTRYWLAEHHNMDGIASSATAVLIGYVASQTQFIRVGSGGIMLPNHSPLLIAEQFGTLESLYPNRIDLGIGRAPGSDQVTQQALNPTPQTREFPDLLRELHSYFDGNGSKSTVHANPGFGLKLPIWLLGSSLYSAQLAASLGLPYAFAGHFAPELLEPALAHYRNHFIPSSELQNPYVMLGVQVVAAKSDEEAHFLATTIDQRFVSLLRGESLRLKPPVKNMAPLWTDYEQRHIQKKTSAAIRGGSDSVKIQLQNLIARTKPDELIFTSDLYDHQNRLQSFKIVSDVLKTHL